MSNRTVGGKKQISSLKRVSFDRLREACESTIEILEQRQLLTAVVAAPQTGSVLPESQTPVGPTPGQSFYVQGTSSQWAMASSITPNTTNDLILNQTPIDTNYVPCCEAGTANNIQVFTNGTLKSNPSPTTVSDPSAADNVIADLTTPWHATYSLGNNPAGYDITEIDSITGHQDYRTQQHIDILIEPVGTDQFVSLSNGAGFSMTTAKDATGANVTLGKGAAQMAIVNDTNPGSTPLATHVKAVEFLNLAGDPAFFRELVVTGTASTTVATGAPAAPSGLTATGDATGAHANLSWTNNATNADGILVERSSDNGNTWSTVALLPTTATTFTDQMPAPNSTFSYRVVAFNNFNGGTQSPSNVVSLTSGNFGVTARFYGQQFWQGPVLATQALGNVDENLGSGKSPVPGTVPDQNYSSVFTGKVHTDLAGLYTFISNTDDDGYLYVNGTLVSSDPGGHGQRDPAASRIIPIQLDANTAYDFVFLQNQGGGGSGFHMLWKEPIPDPNNPGGTIAGPETIVPGDHLSAQDSALPGISSVSANAFSGNVTVNWSINGTDTSSYYYRIDRQLVDSNGNPVNGSQFVTIGQVRSVANPTNPNVEGASLFNDTSAVVGQNYLYRVTAVGFDGSTGASATTSFPVSISGNFQNPGVEERDYANQWWYSNGDPHNIEILHAADRVAIDSSSVDFQWNQGGSTSPSPDPVIPATNWSNIYTGQIKTDQAGVYTLITNTDDDGYLFFNDGTSNSYKLVSQDPGGHGERDASTLIPVTLAANTAYNFIFLHSQGGGGAGAHLKWAEPSFAGTAQGPGTGADTIVLSAATQAGPTNFTGGTITITGGTGKGQAGTITSYDPTSGTAFVNVTTGGTPAPTPGNWTTPPDATSTYQIVALIPTAQSNSGGLQQVMDTPAAPSSLANPAGQLGPNFVGLTWTDNSKSEINYVIERANNSSFTGPSDSVIGTIGIDATSFVDGTVQPGQTYFYRVYAKNFDASGSPSNVISVVTPAAGTQTPGAEQHLYNNQFWNGNNGDPLFINQTGNPDVSSWVSNIDRNYGNFSPDPRIRITNNSQVFTGKILTDQAGVYTLVTNTDDEGYLFLSSATTGWQLVSSDPGGHGQQDASTSARSQDWLVPVTLAANTAYNFVFFQNQGGGGQGAHLKWTEPVAATGTAQSATTTTIVLASGSSSAANGYVGDTITITGGTGKGATAVITSYDPSTGTATVRGTGTNGVWSTTPDNTSTYSIQYLNSPIPAAGSTNSAGGAANGGGLEAVSDVPAAPATLAATVGSNAVQLTWSEPANGSELTWVVERATQANFSDAQVLGITGMTLDKFTDTNVTPGQTYFYRVHGTNFDGSGTAATVSATPIAAASGGTVTAFVNASNTANLNSYGTQDWAHWATNNPGDFTHKASGGYQISDVTVLGPNTLLQAPPLRNSQGGFAGANWGSSDPGMLIRTNGGNGNAVMVHDLGDGLELTAPADATSRVLYLWVNVSGGVGTITARLSDGSAVATQTITGRSLVTLAYSAPASSGKQFLVVDYKLTTDNGDGNVAISSAALGLATDFLPPSNLSFTRCSAGNDATLNWQDNTSGNNQETGFLIEYSADNGTTWQTGGNVGPNVTTFTFPYPAISFDPAKTYQFRVSALGSGNTKATSAVLTNSFMDPINYPNFSSNTNLLQRNGNGSLNTGSGGNPANALEITSASNNQTTSIFTINRYDLSTFDTTFDFEFNHLASNPGADGFTFAMQTNGAGSIGGGGGSLGYQGMPGKSLAVKFDLWNGNGSNGDPDGTNGVAAYTGLFINGDGSVGSDTLTTTAGQTNISYNMKPAIDFHRNFADKFRAHLNYDGTNLTETVTDLTTNGVFTMSWAVNIPQLLGDKCAFVGFTGATGGANAQQDILSWQLTPAPYVPPVNVNNNTVGGTANNDTITIKVDGTNPAVDDIWVNVPTTGAPTQTADITKPIIINGGGGNDTLVVDSTNGQPIPAGSTATPGLVLNQATGGTYILGGTPPTLDATHVVDVTNSTVNIPYSGTSILPAVQSELKNGFITSSNAAASNRKFAIADVDNGSQVTLSYRVIGDLNGNGTVGFEDLLALAQHYNNTGVDWSKGDLNYDGTVAFADLLLLAQHYGQTASAAPAAAASSPVLAAATLDDVLLGKKSRKQ